MGMFISIWAEKVRKDILEKVTKLLKLNIEDDYS